MENTQEVVKIDLTAEEIQKRTIEFAKKLIEHVRNEAGQLEQPAPVAVILNSLMYIYLSIVLNTVPNDMRKGLVEDHFARVMKDLDDHEKLSSNQSVEITEEPKATA